MHLFSLYLTFVILVMVYIAAIVREIIMSPYDILFLGLCQFKFFFKIFELYYSIRSHKRIKLLHFDIGFMSSIHVFYLLMKALVISSEGN